jgi:hypothetical protein
MLLAAARSVSAPRSPPPLLYGKRPGGPPCLAGVHSYRLLPIGWMGKFGPVGRAPLSEVVYKDRWGEPYRGV